MLYRHYSMDRYLEIYIEKKISIFTESLVNQLLCSVHMEECRCRYDYDKSHAERSLCPGRGQSTDGGRLQ